MIDATVIRKNFGGRDVLGRISLRIERGEVFSIEGPSGVGKSTLLRILSGLDQNFEGEVNREGRLSMIFQEPRLMPWRSVGENLRLTTKASAAEIAMILARVGLEGYAETFPRALSLGQARRVAIARAFVIPPEILMMDEPFTSLDPDRVQDLLALTRDLIAEAKPATLMVSHSAMETEALGGQRLRMIGAPAQLVAVNHSTQAGEALGS